MTLVITSSNETLFILLLISCGLFSNPPTTQFRSPHIILGLFSFNAPSIKRIQPVKHKIMSEQSFQRFKGRYDFDERQLPTPHVSNTRYFTSVTRKGTSECVKVNQIVKNNKDGEKSYMVIFIGFGTEQEPFLVCVKMEELSMKQAMQISSEEQQIDKLMVRLPLCDIQVIEELSEERIL